MKSVFGRIDRLAIGISLLALAIGVGFQAGAPVLDSRLETARTRIRDAFASIPDGLGSERQWAKVSDDLVPPTQADMLGLNAHVNRTYQRLGDVPIRRAQVFIANSVDARSMAGHHPPNCYPKSGLYPIEGGERGVEIDTSIGTKIPVRIYRFRGGNDDSVSLLVVSGFLMPDGSAVATLEETRGLASRAATSRLGLTQFQIVFDGALPASDLDRYAGEILGGIPEEVYLAVGGVVDGLEDAHEGGAE